ncbi:ribonuclease H [archaeon]|nr:ribonuclease H [archaeon]NCQ51718.1 ribonuclease H [archaeon]
MAQFYGVWVGRVTGVYDNWNDCKLQTEKFAGAQYKKLISPTKEQALIEFNSGYYGKNSSSTKKEEITKVKSMEQENVPLDGFLTVDGASNGLNCEFQAVWHPSNERAFSSKVYQGGTNNIAEFLGLVFSIKYLKDKGLPIKIYTDSVTAMAWCRKCKANTTANQTGKATHELDDLISKAEKFLNENQQLISDGEILKWETKQWGEIPADYGRK